RLVCFYVDYTRALLNPKFLRLSSWARLVGSDHLNAKYTEMLNAEILPRIARALRHELLGESRPRVSARDLELVQTLHGSIYYVGLRRMHERLPADVNDIVISKIDVFLDGAASALEKLPRGGGAGRG
ncbi:hypothetical protein, partial [Ramlibacter sp.]|uniref:hypothetical protein n=1 Tax=Ramlibacter sp. TaxID=1917967 RepID=UPI003D0D9BFC